MKTKSSIFGYKYNEGAKIVIFCVTSCKIVFSKHDFIIIIEIMFIFVEVCMTVISDT